MSDPVASASPSPLSDPAKHRPVALVTGSGAKRVGRAVAEALARRGYRLVLHANSSLKEAQEAAKEFGEQDVEAIALQADLTDERAVKSLVADAVSHFGRIDALVHCAAIWSPKPLEDVSAADVRKNLEANTVGSFLICQHVGLQMVSQPAGGAIVALGDWAVVRPYLDYAAYFPSKGAIPTLVRTFAVELSHRNPRIRVNGILPGPVMLPPDLPAAEREAAIAGTLVKREGSPEHVAHAAVFLLENEFVTGVCLPVDGGRTIASGE
ncbi:MAG TPA: SDR family oxidoreductase [Pirellulales bacterium]